jgi:phosphoglycolate phosphatase-like HAD superfamily hydrolase
MTGRARVEEQAGILREVLASARAAAPSGVVIFDLDSTLLDNRPRQALILREYGARSGLEALRDARPTDLDGWDLGAALLRLGVPPLELARHLPPLRRFWAGRFFTSEACRADVPVPGAARFVGRVADAGAVVAYVTGRPARMERGTREVLRAFGFPVPDGVRARLLMKPGPEGDDAWKARAASQVAALGPVVAAFDNEPSHVNGYALAFPGARCVHLDTDHSGRPVEVLARVPSIRDFRLDGAGDPDERGAPPLRSAGPPASPPLGSLERPRRTSHPDRPTAGGDVTGVAGPVER